MSVEFGHCTLSMRRRESMRRFIKPWHEEFDERAEFHTGLNQVPVCHLRGDQVQTLATPVVSNVTNSVQSYSESHSLGLAFIYYEQ